MTRKILFAGGTGVVGSRAVTIFRERHPEQPLLIGGRDLHKAQTLAHKISFSEAVTIDLQDDELGLEAKHHLAAIVMLVPDIGLKGLRLAQRLGIPYLSIGNWLAEVGGEMAYFISQPNAAPIILASHWHGGPAVFLAKIAASQHGQFHTVKVSAIVDELDPTGPAALADMEEGGVAGSGVLTFANGARSWLSREAATRQVLTIDGRELLATAIAPYDIVSIHAVTKADNIRFDVASGVSSSRRRDGVIGTELIIEFDGYRNGEPYKLRGAFEYTKGQAALTGMSVVLALSTALGLEEKPPLAPGLYFPETFMDEKWFISQLIQAGGSLIWE